MGAERDNVGELSADVVLKSQINGAFKEVTQIKQIFVAKMH